MRAILAQCEAKNGCYPSEVAANIMTGSEYHRRLAVIDRMQRDGLLVRADNGARHRNKFYATPTSGVQLPAAISPECSDRFPSGFVRSLVTDSSGSDCGNWDKKTGFSNCNDYSH